MNRRLQAQKEKEQKAKNKGLLIIGLSSLVILFIFAGIMFLQPEKLDDNGCPESGVEAKTIVLLDVSDPLNSFQKASLSDGDNSLLVSFEKVSNDSIERGLGIGKSHQLSVWVMNEKGSPPSLKGKLCSPGSRDTETLRDTLSKGKTWRDLTYDEYRDNILDLFPKDLDSNRKDSSPILQSIKYVINYEHGEVRNEFQKSKPNRLIIISDMLENGEKYSHFKNLPKFDIVEKLNLNGIIVRIKYLKNINIKVSDRETSEMVG